MFILPKRLVRSAPSAAFAAAVFVIGAAVAADATHVAAAQGRLEAEYTASLSGIPVGRGNWVIEISEDQFTATASGGTIGILRFFSSGHGTAASQGTVSAGQPVPTTYASTMTNDKRVDDVHMVFAGGNVKDFTVEPPVGPHPDRIPVSDADRHNVVDPLSATLDLVSGNGDPICAANSSASKSSRPKRATRDRLSSARSISCRFPVTSPTGTRSNISPRCAMPRSGWRRSQAPACWCLIASRCRRRSVRVCCKRRNSSPSRNRRVRRRT